MHYSLFYFWYSLIFCFLCVLPQLYRFLEQFPSCTKCTINFKITRTKSRKPNLYCWIWSNIFTINCENLFTNLSSFRGFPLRKNVKLNILFRSIIISPNYYILWQISPFSKLLRHQFSLENYHSNNIYFNSIASIQTKIFNSDNMLRQSALILMT